MEAQQFDHWTERFAGASRRDALKLLTAGLGGGLLAGAGARHALAQVGVETCGKDGDRCKKNSDCCSDYKCNNNDKCKKKSGNGCGKDGDHCKKNSDCCSDYKCNNNDKCKKKSGNGCGKDGDHCKKNSDCCSNYKCNNNDKCKKK